MIASWWNSPEWPPSHWSVKALLNGRWDAEVTEAMASSKSHLGSMGAHRNRGAFLDLGLCAKEQLLHSQDRRTEGHHREKETPQDRVRESGPCQRPWGLSKTIAQRQPGLVLMSHSMLATLLKGNILLQRQKRWSFTPESAWNSQADTTQFLRA